MQNVTADTPRGDVTIQGVVLSVARPFAEGHVCNEGEAGALNQLLAENVRNNMAGRIKRVIDDGAEPNVQEFQNQLDTYVLEYEFGKRSGGGRGMDPVEKEARLIGAAVNGSTFPVFAIIFGEVRFNLNVM